MGLHLTRATTHGSLKVALLLGLVSALLFGLATPLSKMILKESDPLPLASLFYLGAALFLSPFLAWQHQQKEEHHKAAESLTAKDKQQLLGAIFFGGIAGPALLLIGIRLILASTSSLLLNMETAATAILAWFYFRENMGKRALLGVVGIMGASILLTAATPGGDYWGGIFIILACFCWGLDNNFTARIDSVSSAGITWVKGSVGGIINGLIALVTGAIWPSPLYVLGALTVGGLAYGASIVLYIESARLIGALRSQLVFAMAPFFGFGLSFLFAGMGIISENLSWSHLVAIPLLVGSLGLVFTEQHAHTHLHPEMHHTHYHRHDDEHHGHEHPRGLRINGSRGGYHEHNHVHDPHSHEHPHLPDLHHAHEH